MKVYKEQVKLLLTVLPEIAKEYCFALHGGTAINLFVRNMPRLSIDIDLTYLPLENRNTSLQNINRALQRIKKNIESLWNGTYADHRLNEAKLVVHKSGVIVKVEVNLIKRGCYAPPQKMELCSKAQKEFDAFCVIQVVEKGHLYGGKICAALDRQHPRDLFDVKFMLQNEKFSKEIKKGFIFYLISGDRPVRELLFPNFKDQKSAFENQFMGMTDENFDYTEYEQTREKLVNIVQTILIPEDKEFLLSIKQAEPAWNIYDFRDFPAIKWKLQNIQKLKDNQPLKHQKLFNSLRDKLYE